tara:strand:+ start:112 stop:531 length:420 start_codon:yes stop_codon:yes gene_type:complete
MKSQNNKISDCSIINLDKVHTESGNITVLENHTNIPFDIKRVYYLYDIPSGEARGGHAHYELEQYIIAASGSFDVILNDGFNKKKFSLNRPNVALHIIPGMWRELENFSSGSIAMVFASNEYDENDYIRNYQEFLNFKI